MPPIGPISPSNVTGANAKSSANTDMAIITTESLNTVAGSTYTHTHSNPMITPDSVVLASVQNGSNSQGDVSLGRVTTTLGQVVITIVNRHGSQAFNGTLVISLVVHN